MLFDGKYSSCFKTYIDREPVKNDVQNALIVEIGHFKRNCKNMPTDNNYVIRVMKDLNKKYFYNNQLKERPKNIQETGHQPSSANSNE